MVNTKIQAR